MNPSRGVSIFVPVLDEAEILAANAERILAAARGLGKPFEVVIVSNGSTDATPDLGRDLAARRGEVVFEHLPERGPGRALRRVLDRFRYDRVIALDIDLPIDLAFLAAADRALDEAAVVLGSKQAGRQNRALLRRVGSALFVAVADLLLDLPYRDYSIGAKGYRLDFLRAHRDLVDDVTGYVLPLAYAARREGAGVAEIPVECLDLRASRFNLAREGLYRFAHLARFWWRTGRVTPSPSE